MSPIIIIRLVDSASAAYGAATTTTGTVHLWGAMATGLGDLTNIVAYQPSTTSIHRQYAPTLKSVATAGQPRFEYDPSSDGQSVAKGILIESQATNLATYSTNGFNASNAFVWSSDSIVTTENAAVAPSGNLEATLVRENGTTNQHNFYQLITATAAPHTYSIYVKDAGVGHVGFRLLGPSSYGLVFNLSDGSTSAFYNPVDSYGYEDVGNGWKRIWVTKTLTAAPHNMMIYLMRGNGANNYAGDNYSGLLWYGAQIEQSSHPSSYVDTGTSGSAATRASESLAVDTADIGYTGGPVTIVGEVGGGYGASAIADLRNSSGSSDNYLLIWKATAAAVDSSVFTVYSKESGTLQTGQNITGSGGATTVAVSMDTNNISSCADGGSVTTDTSAVIPAGLNKLWIGNSYSGFALNSNLKRFALYNEALSDTNLQAITS